jgi:RND family efflux transporter MFP subunit
MNSSIAKSASFLKILFVRLRFIFVFVILGVIVGNWDWILNLTDRLLRPAAPKDFAAGDVEYYCPMHPSVVRDDPKAKCPICGMPLSKRKRGEKTALPEGVLARLELTPLRVQQAGLATAEVAYRRLSRELRVAGAIELDERKLARVSARTAGRIERLFADFTGARVKAKDPLALIYSPALVSTQEEYLLARAAEKQLGALPQHEEAAAGRAAELARSARERLMLWGVSEEQIAKIEAQGRAETFLEILSPIDGTVIARRVAAGQYVAEGEKLFTVVDLSSVWMQAEVFESDIGLLREGLAADVEVEAQPGERFAGQVAFIQPTLSSETRSVKARIEIPNADGRLKPGMFARAFFQIPLGGAAELYYGCCGSCPDVRSETPGKCPKCGMDLVPRGGLQPHEGHEAEKPKEVAPASIFVCDMHPETVSTAPGTCAKCSGMVLEERKVPPGGRIVYVCPDHPEIESATPGVCPKDGKALRYRIRSPSSRFAEIWSCPQHPGETSDAKRDCPQCEKPMERMEIEQLLAVPFGAVIDSGQRRIVFIDRGHGVFEAVEVELGPRAGEYYPVKKGLNAGDRVVAAGAFLLDAETRYSPGAAAQYFGASGGGTEGGGRSDGHAHH